MPSPRGRIRADIHGYIEYLSLNDTNQFGLGMGGFLEVQTSQDPLGGFGFVVLDKFDTGQELLKVVEVVALFEIAAVISIDCGFDEENVGDGLGGDFKFHTIKFLSQLKLYDGIPIKVRHSNHSISKPEAEKSRNDP